MASKQRQQTQRVERKLGWTGPQETWVLDSCSSVTISSFDIRLCVSSGPQSSHLSDRESNL